MKIDITPMIRSAQTRQWLKVPKAREVLGLLQAVDLDASQKQNTLRFDPASPIVSELCNRSASGESGPIARIKRLTYSNNAYHCRVICPHCGSEHGHGLGTDTLPVFGHREASCGRGSYHLAAGVKE
jgi:hypothetical protein